jgi:basic amino acid/polyamine antiporter, APA family
MKSRVFGFPQMTAFVIAAMIGTGVFTSLGMQVKAIPSVPAIILLWIVGGIASLTGALAYAELGAAQPRSGGEYHLLGTIYTPTLGFIAGVATLVAGLAAPIALSAVAFGKYAQNLVSLPEPVFTVGVILLATVVHSVNVRFGAALHSGVTYFNVGLILVFIVFAFLAPQPAPSLVPTANDFSLILTPAYAVSFVFVSYAYLGWNTSVYVIDEIKDVQKTLPRSVITGVIVVTALYVVLNYAFLKVASIPALAGKLDVGYIAAKGMFGERGALVMSALIALVLLASVSSYTVLGPRVWNVMGEDYAFVRFAAVKNKHGVAVRAFWLQAAIAITIVLTSSFEAILIYTGFLLNVFNMLAVVGVIILRWKYPAMPRPYKVWGYPVTPLLFAVISFWMAASVVVERPKESLAVLATFALGFLLNIGRTKRDANTPEEPHQS